MLIVLLMMAFAIASPLYWWCTCGTKTQSDILDIIANPIVAALVLLFMGVAFGMGALLVLCIVHILCSILSWLSTHDLF